MTSPLAPWTAARMLGQPHVTTADRHLRPSPRPKGGSHGAAAALAAACMIAAASELSAAPAGDADPRGGRALGWESHPEVFDPATLEHLAGRVVRVEHAVEYVAPLRGISTGVRLVVRTRRESIRVHLGPTWYVERRKPTIAVGDRIEVTGSRVTIDGTAAVVAIRIRKGAATLILRDPGGMPAWRGSGAP